MNTQTIAVIGLGYVGLPFAINACDKGFMVYGIDLDQAKIETLKKGRSYIKSVPHKTVAKYYDDLRLSFYGKGAVANSDVVVICVPTPLGDHQEPDLSYIIDTAESIVPFIKDGQLIVLESTTYPGTTSEILKPILDKSGKEYYLAYSPEREDPGNKDFNTSNIPKVIGADNDVHLAHAVNIYSQLFDTVIPVSSTKVAEATKLLENIYRCVNIALVNELKMIYDKMGINIWEVIEAASTKPFGFTPFYPGPGLGGHCIPIDPFYLTWKAKEYGIRTKFIETAGEINTMMPEYVVNKTMRLLFNQNSMNMKEKLVMVVGIAYKPDIDDLRESPALEIIELLQKEGCIVSYHDPYVAEIGHSRDDKGYGMECTDLSAKSIAMQDAVIICTNHSNIDYETIQAHAKIIIDTRNVIPDADNVWRA